jgi:hypothetical protein
MTKISSDLLSDTLNLVQLARETALARGNQTQAERLKPVADNLNDLVTSARQPKASSPHPFLIGQPDFQTLLQIVQESPKASETQSFAERGQVINAMAAAGMADVDIARHMGITRDEVHLALDLGQKNQGI